MATTKTARPGYRCADCGWTTGKWVGRCGECQAWGTVDIAAPARTGRTQAAPVASPAIPISQVTIESARSETSGIGELDRVLGGGVVPGAVLLLAGEPGVGKSTLLLEVAARWARAGRRTLYVSGEESAAQVRLRAERTGAVHDLLYLAAETDLGALLTHVETVKPGLLIVDSVQTIGSADVDGVPGGVDASTRGGLRGHPARQVSEHRDPSRRSRHQGRISRRATSPRAPRRRRAAVRGRSQLPSSPAARRQEPLRPRRRDRLF